MTTDDHGKDADQGETGDGRADHGGQIRFGWTF